MKIVKLTSSSVSNVVAQVHKNKKNLYFNIKHGNNGHDLWVYSCGLSKSHFMPNAYSDMLELVNDNYILLPVKKDGCVLKDGIGNILYTISIDHMDNHKKDVVLFWEIPNKNYKDVTYTAKGICSILGNGITGRIRGDIMYSSPAPVIEILGDVILEWKGTDSNGQQVQQHIEYDYINGKWNIAPIKILAKE